MAVDLAAEAGRAERIGRRRAELDRDAVAADQPRPDDEGAALAERDAARILADRARLPRGISTLRRVEAADVAADHRADEPGQVGVDRGLEHAGDDRPLRDDEVGRRHAVDADGVGPCARHPLEKRFVGRQLRPAAASTLAAAAASAGFSPAVRSTSSAGVARPRRAAARWHRLRSRTGGARRDDRPAGRRPVPARARRAPAAAAGRRWSTAAGSRRRGRRLAPASAPGW